jgi:hypothetical protein
VPRYLPSCNDNGIDDREQPKLGKEKLLKDDSLPSFCGSSNFPLDAAL